MSEKKNNSNNDLSREKINEELEKVKGENSKEPGIFDAIKWGPFVTCYLICIPPFMREILGKNKDSKTCPQCNVELQPDPEKKYDFRCPKCKKGFNYSDLTDSKQN